MNFSEIEVEAEQVAPSFALDETPVVEEEFIINEIVTNVRDIEVIDAEHLTVEEKSQISFEFDLPIMEPEAVQKETIQLLDKYMATPLQCQTPLDVGLMNTFHYAINHNSKN